LSHGATPQPVTRHNGHYGRLTSHRHRSPRSVYPARPHTTSPLHSQWYGHHRPYRPSRSAPKGQVTCELRSPVRVPGRPRTRPRDLARFGRLRLPHRPDGLTAARLADYDLDLGERASVQRVPVQVPTTFSRGFSVVQEDVKSRRHRKRNSGLSAPRRAPTTILLPTFFVAPTWAYAKTSRENQCY